MNVQSANANQQPDTRLDLAGIRIARISTVPFFVIAQLSSQIETLVAHGASVTVVSSDGPELNNASHRPNAPWKVIEIPRSVSPLRDLIALFQLYFFFKRECIQIAHSTTPKAGVLTAVAAFLAGVPVRIHTFTGQPWVNMHGLKRWLVRGCDRLIGSLNTACYADSASQRNFLLAQGLLRAEKLNVIGSGSLAGVDIQRFSKEHFPPDRCNVLRESMGIPVNATVFLFVGRITAEKGVRELLCAFGELKSSREDSHLVIVGSFDDDGGVPGVITRDEISKYSDTHIVGYTECPESYMAMADVLCLPSYREGFGTVVIEAAAMGVPTVGTRIYGLSDAVEDGQTGILVAPRDSDALRGALQTMLSDVPLRLRMGNRAMLRARACFDAGAVNAAVVETYLGHLRQQRIGLEVAS